MLKKQLKKWLGILDIEERISETTQSTAGDILNNHQVKMGRVVKHTTSPEYTPDTTRKGGRMVRRMPRQLEKIKEGQEYERDS